MKAHLVYIAVLACILVVLYLPNTIYAHGAKIEYTVSTSIDIVAKYDNGEPMSGGQVSIYAPDNPSTPWLTGVCDEQGRFSFTPDLSLPGTWDIQVRQAGHGDMIHIKIEEGSVSGESSGNYSVAQIEVMSVCVIWGLIGTALFFKRRKI